VDPHGGHVDHNWLVAVDVEVTMSVVKSLRRLMRAEPATTTNRSTFPRWKWSPRIIAGSVVETKVYP
jgi:hypothetical protein